MFSKYDVPSHITFNRSLEFVSNFFQSLDTALDIQLHFTSGYHSKCDGQTKHMNQTLEQYLYVYCNYQQDNWSKLLLFAEFSYNNAPSVTTGVSLFFANKGYHLNITVHSEWNIASSKAYNFAVDLDKLQNILKAEISMCHMQVHPPGNYIPMVILIPNYISPLSIAATFLTTCLMVVLQPSGYSVFHSRDTPIQLSLP